MQTISISTESNSMHCSSDMEEEKEEEAVEEEEDEE